MHSRDEKAALERLAKDIKILRTRSEKTLTEIHEDTRVPLEVLRKLEANLLVDDGMFNHVYLRSILRGYADAIHLDKNIVLDAFVLASEGKYDESDSIAGQIQSVDDGDDPDDANSGGKPATTDSNASETSTAPKQEVDKKPAKDRKANRPSGSKRKFQLPKFDFKKGSIGVVVLAAVITGVLVVNRLVNPNVSVSDSQDAQSTTHSSPLIPGAIDPSAEPSVEAVEQVPAPFVMPEIVDVKVFATDGVFDPIRVRIDRDLRRPYWADTTDTLRFQFVDRMIVEDHVARMEILVENEPYPIDRSDRQVVLTRKRVQQFLESRNSSGR